MSQNIQSPGADAQGAPNPVRQDALTPLRLFSRGYLAGVAAESLSVSGTLRAEAQVLVAMEHMGIAADMRWAIMDYATMTAELELGSVDPYTVRYFAAEIVLAYLRLAWRKRVAQGGGK